MKYELDKASTGGKWVSKYEQYDGEIKWDRENNVDMLRQLNAGLDELGKPLKKAK